MFMIPGTWDSTSQTHHFVSKYPFGVLSWSMVRVRVAIVSVSK